ncbi:MAG: HD domain-containing phosphohydrolase, partial [Vulcanimicrobiaceae bacterium]
ALAWSEDHQADLAIVDYHMPPPNGIEFVQTFKGQAGNATVPVIMITGVKDRSVRHAALEHGVDDFLEKPADSVEFLVRSRNLLRLRERSVELANRADRLAEEVRRATEQIAHRELETIHRLTRAAEHRDKETHNHIVRMGHYAKLLGGAIGLANDRQELLRYAAPMHDIGKVAIPDNILLKNGRLSSSEWTKMMTHARSGYDILKDSDSEVLRLAAEIALTHHEKWDGSGYPQGLVGEAIPLSGRITAIADVLDALLSVRPYKPAWPLPEVIDALRRGKHEHFDPVLIDAFLDIIPDLQRIRAEFSDLEAA